MLFRSVGREKWDRFLNDYFRRHAFKTMNTEVFLKELQEELFSNDSAGFEKLMIRKWIYEPGLPENRLVITSAKFENVERVLQQWVNGKKATELPVSGWSAFEWIHFIQQLPPQLSKLQIEELENAFHFSKSGNNEVLFNWMQHCLISGDQSIYPALEDFLIQVGRRKYVKPLFQELVKTDAGRDEADKIFEQAKQNYHSITRETVEGILNEKVSH